MTIARLSQTTLEAFDRERTRIEDELEVFARTLATDYGQPVGDDYHFDGWSLHAGMVNVKFYLSDQCGGDTIHTRFPADILIDPGKRLEHIQTKIDEKIAANEKERERLLRADRAELDRVLARIEKRQREVATRMGWSRTRRSRSRPSHDL